MFLSECFKNLSENNVKTLFPDLKFPKNFRQKQGLLIMQNCSTLEISFPYFLVKKCKTSDRFLFFIFSLVEALHFFVFCCPRLLECSNFY